MTTSKPSAISFLVVNLGYLTGIPSGGDAHALALARELAAAGCKAVLMLPQPCVQLAPPGVDVQGIAAQLSTNWVRFSLDYLLRIRRACRRVKDVPADVVLATQGWFDLLPALAHRRRHGSRLAVMVFHLLPPRRAARLGDRMRNAVARWAEWMALRWMRDADLILAGNEAVRDAFVARGFPPDRVRLHYPAVEVEEIRSAPPGSACDVIFVGRLVKQKGIYDFLRLVERLDLHFTICGDGPEREAAVAWVKERGLAERVEWVRGLSRAELLGRITSSRCFVAPSYEEGFGLAVAEAIVAGTSVVAYDLPAFREVFGSVPRYAPVGDIDALCDAVAGVLADQRAKVEPDLSATRIRGASEAAQEFRVALSTLPNPPSKPLGMVRFLWREHGLAAPVVVAGRLAAYLWVRRPTRPSSFTLDGRSYPYLLVVQNGVYRTERAVEIPVALNFFPRSGDILEVGNVLNLYSPFAHDVVDKYEMASGVINEDVTEYTPGKSYDLILSLSTLEHVGWDESPRDADKPARAIAHLASLLKPGGRMLVTFPIGYNPELDRRLESGLLGFTRQYFMKRTTGDNQWVETSLAEALACPFGDPFPCAGAIGIGIVEKPLL